MTMEAKTANNVGNYGAVRDRIEELRDDMEDGFSGLRSKVQEMDADELRRELSLLMMIGSSQMGEVRRLRRDIEVMDQDLIRLHGERAEFERAARKLVDAMEVPFDPDDFSPAKLVRTAATVAGRYAERRMQPFEMEAHELEAPADRRESGVEVAMVVALSVFVLCAVVWTVMMSSAWL